MSLRTRFILIFGIGGIFFLLVITSLVFYRVESTMKQQLEQQFHNDVHARVHSLNHSFSEITERFQSTAKLPMFRSMRFHQLTMNHAAFKNDVRQMELYILDIVNQYDEISQVMYINNKGAEVFRVDRSGIKSNLSDRSQDKVINKMMEMRPGDLSVTQESVNGKIRNIVWWIPIYVSADKLDGVIGFRVRYNYILDTIGHLATSDSEEVCLASAQGAVLLSANNKKTCEPENKLLWQTTEPINLPDLSWMVTLSVNPDVFLVDVRNIAMTVFGVIFPLVAVLGFVFSFVFSNKIIRSIHQLVDAAQIMGRGQPLVPIDLNRDDELGELAKEINRSAKLIEENLNELEERNRDTVERNRRNMQAIMDHSPAIIYLKDTNGCYTFINQKFEDIFNIKREDVIGKSDHEVLPQDIADDFSHNAKAVIEAEKALETEEVISLDGSLHAYVSIRFPLVDDKGIVYAVCGISTDITDIKQHEEQIRRSQKMDALGKLTGGVAHDYNNMLGIILGYSELLANKLSNQPDLAKFAQEIQRAGERGVKLTNKLLGFSRKKSSVAEVLNINDVLHDDKHMLQKTLTARINLVLDLEDGLCDVFLDGSELEDAILNMSINAMHSMEAGGQLTFQTQNKYIDGRDARSLDMNTGNFVVLNIIDTGCGIDKPVLDKIFDPFFSTKGDRGTGLGLSQVYGFVQSNGGNIKVYSEPGKGTHFSLYFPSYYGKDNDNELEKDKKLETLTGKETILIVDDEPALLDLAAEILSQQEYKVICAQSARQALDLLENNTVDLMLSDVIMPEIDGYQLAASVQKKYPDVKIQLVSGFSDDRHLNMVDDNLHKNLISKPYNAQELLQGIRKLLG